MRRASAILVATCALALAAGSTAAARPGTAASAPQRVAVYFVLKNKTQALRRFVAQVSDPASPRYRHYLTIEQARKRFGAALDAQRAVRSWLRAHGLRARVDPTGTYVKSWTASPPRAVPPSLRSDVSGVAVRGPDPIPRPAVPGENPYTKPYSSARPRTGTPAGCAAGRHTTFIGLPDPAKYNSYGLTPNQYLRAYGFDKLLGRHPRAHGRRIAVVEDASFKRSDIVEFATCFGLPVPHLRSFRVDLAKALPASGETTLDLEVLTAAAPHLKSIDVYESLSLLDAVAAPISQRSRRPEVISMSYGGCEAFYSGESAYLQAFNTVVAFEAAAGITFLASAGDTGSAGCELKAGDPLPLIAVNFPAASPYATAVGGLNLTLTPANRLATELVWNEKVDGFGAGGGAVSLLFDHPWWQNTRGYASRKRIVPDVAMLADPLPGYAIRCTVACRIPGVFPGGWVTIGGTSAAAPLLAAGIANANREARIHHQRPLGFVNPLLYAVARVKSLGVIRDVTKGNNDIGLAYFGQRLHCCAAGPGFDPASGLGSVNVDAFSKAARLAARHKLPKRAYGR